MSVTSQTSQNTYQGDGSTSLWAWTFQLLPGSTGSEIQVWIIDDQDTETLLSSNYSIDLVSQEVTYPVTGGVSPLAPGVNKLPVGWSIVIARVLPLTQDLVLSDSGPFSLVDVMVALDKLTMIVQQQQALMDGNVPGLVSTLKFYQGTYAELKALSAASPNALALGWATDAKQFMTYNGDPSSGDQGWTVFGG